ncbi:MAG: type IV pilin protein [Agarilytica sp.]
MSRFDKGFSLIELLIVLAIIAIIAAIAVPSYRSYVQKSCRNDARSSILEVVARQEKHYFQYNAYAATLDDTGLNFLSDGVTPEGCYEIALSDCGSDDCYTITATATGGQASDTSCSSFTMDHMGRKTALGGVSDPTDYCW